MGIVRVKEFEEEFEQEEIEIYALLREAPNGAAAYLKDYLRPLVYTDATVDCKTGVLDRREGILTWLISSDREAGKPTHQRYFRARPLHRGASPGPDR